MNFDGNILTVKLCAMKTIITKLIQHTKRPIDILDFANLLQNGPECILIEIIKIKTK
jgi:hypothetical protein